MADAHQLAPAAVGIALAAALTVVFAACGLWLGPEGGARRLTNVACTI